MRRRIIKEYEKEKARLDEEIESEKQRLRKEVEEERLESLCSPSLLSYPIQRVYYYQRS
jgi:hypothetical protein